MGEALLEDHVISDLIIKMIIVPMMRTNTLVKIIKKIFPPLPPGKGPMLNPDDMSITP
jgi:hypothetical protein